MGKYSTVVGVILAVDAVADVMHIAGNPRQFHRSIIITKLL